MEVSDARRLKALEGENAKLKRLVAEQLLVIEGLNEFSGKKNELPGGSSRSCGAAHAPGCIAARGLPVAGKWSTTGCDSRRRTEHWVHGR
jgi:hypothetical protein